MIEIGPIAALALVCLTSVAVAIALMPLAVRFGYRFNLVDLPRPGEAQVRPLPRTGGYALFPAVLVGVLVSVVFLKRFDDEWPKLLGLGLGAALIIPFALLDDWKRLPPWPQFIAQIVVAAVPVAFGVQIDQVSSPFGGGISVPGHLGVPLTVIWIVGMINTVNFADGIDGLAGGIGLIAAGTLFVVSVGFGQFSIAALPLALAGACLVFLRLNFFPSRLILGTSGSMLVGYLLAVLSIIGGAKIATALMVLGLPIADVATVIVYRLVKRRSPFRGGDRAHLHHRLLALGLTQRQVAFVFYALCASFGLLAVALPLGRAYGLIGQALVVSGVLAYVLSRQRNASRSLASPVDPTCPTPKADFQCEDAGQQGSHRMTAEPDRSKPMAIEVTQRD